MAISSRLLTRIGRQRSAIANLGLFNWLSYWRRRALPTSRREYTLASRYARFPIQCRVGSTDLRVFHQIFVEREYSCLDAIADATLIIDCGANIGCSSAYFLTRYPNCQVVAIEPDPENYKTLCENLRPYGDRVKTLRAAIWSHPTIVALIDDNETVKESWARQVREVKQGDVAHIPAIDIGSVLRESGRSRISILKMDIEGAEAVVFGSNFEDWLNKVEAIVIELHDGTQFGSGRSVFQQAIGNSDWEISESGELTVCRRKQTSCH